MKDYGAQCLPLLPLQQGMVLTLFAHPHAGVDVQQCIARVREPFDAVRFTRAWQLLLERHEGLRTHFVMRGVECLQQIATHADARITSIDWQKLSPRERHEAFETFLDEDRERGFDLSVTPVWRVTAFDCGEEGFRFVFAHPHAIVDAQSAFCLLQDLFAFYGDPTARLPPGGTLREYMDWHAQHDSAAAATCWREIFKGFESPAALMVQKPDDPDPGHDTFEHVIDPALGERIRRVADQQKLPFSAVIKAVWSIILTRLSLSSDVVFGEVRSGRRKDVPNMQSTVGMFVATIPVRVEVRREQKFRDLVDRLRNQQIAVRDHEHTALADIQKWCGLDRGSPLFDSAIVYDHMSFAARVEQLGGAWLGREITYREHTAVPITLNVTALPEIVIKVSWHRSRFSRALMERVPGYFQNLLEAFADDPERTVSSMDMLDREERERLLVSWNATSKKLDDATSLAQAFERAVNRHPQRTAVTCEVSSYTYRELDRAVNRLSVEMQRLGVKRGSLVGLCIDRSIGMLVAMLATLKTGAGYVPLDPSFPDERLEFMVSDAKPALVVASSRHAERFAGTGAQVLHVDEQLLSRASADSNADAGPVVAEAGSVQAADVAYVIYTSGSTGRPKGVMVTHLNVLNCFAGMDEVLGLPSNNVGLWLAVTSISFDISVIELLWTLTRGFGITISRDSADPMEIVRLLQSGHITHMQCTPALARMLAAVPGGVDQLRRLDRLLLGGEALAQDLISTLRRPIINMYGPTETAIWSTAAHLKSDDIHIGRPIANTRLYLLDANRALVPTGVAGELYIGGLGVAKGYLERPELDAERFLPDPFVDGSGAARMYRTGDVVRYRDDGSLEYLERLDNQVKILGHRIELGEIEGAMRGLPQVADAVVLARKNETGEKRLVAFLMLAPGFDGVDHDQLRSQLGSTLPNYEIPTRFLVLPTLPLTPNLKVDRKALADLEGVSHVAARREGVAPRSELERGIARLWQEVLGVERVGITDNFFSLGGDSLRAVQVALSIRAALGMEVAGNALHQHPTIEALAASLSGQAQPSGEAWATWETLGEHEAGTPIIGVHGVDRIFIDLAKHLGLRVDVTTCRVGFDGKQAPYYPAKSVEDMAERYLEAVRARYPRGPYILMGFCLGGLIATEMARRLIDAGEQVSFLGLFNSPPPPRAAESLRAKFARHRREIGAQNLAGALRYAVEHSAGHAASIFRSVLQRVRVALPGKPPADVAAVDQATEISRRVAAFGMQMVTEHRYPAYPGRVHLFHGAHWAQDYRNRWADVARDGAEGFLLPGGHIDMMEEPHVRIVAERVRETLPRV